MLWIILAVIISYVIGSIPTAYIAGRLLKGIDIRKFGSGNVGATNALRVLGKRAGIAVLFIDVLKGVLPVILIADFVLIKGIDISADLLRIIIGVACIVGHSWTIFLNFKGGKGVATSLGVMIGLSFKIYGLAKILSFVMLVWFIAFFILRIVSIASVFAGFALPLFIILFKMSLSLVLFSLLISSFVIYRHRTNLVRFLKGKEPRLSFKKTLS